MAMSITNDHAISWLKEFQCQWLPERIGHDTTLQDAINTKLNELCLILNGQNVDDYDRTHCPLEHDEYNSENGQHNGHSVPQQSEGEQSSFTSSDVQHHSENAKENDVTPKFHRPKIQLKRIPLAEAACFLPNALKMPNGKGQTKRKRKNRSFGFSNNKRAKKKKAIVSNDDAPIVKTPLKNGRSKRNVASRSLTEHQSTSSFVSNQSTANEKKTKSKRRLHAPANEFDELLPLNSSLNNEFDSESNHCGQIERHIGQNGILSQTRKLQETTTVIVSDEITVTNSTVLDSSLIISDVATLDGEGDFEVMREIRPEETSFDETKQNSTAKYPDGIEDISNDGMDPVSSTFSAVDQEISPVAR